MQTLQKMSSLVRVAVALLATLSIAIPDPAGNLCFADEDLQDRPIAATRPLTIQGADHGILRASVAGPRFHPPELFQGFEDYYHPRLKRLRDEYELDKVVEGEPSEFRRMLKLRHWVHSRWPIDNNQRFGGDAFAILEKAKAGAGFNCSHSMAVQQAVMSSLGYLARNLGVDCNHEELGYPITLSNSR